MLVILFVGLKKVGFNLLWLLFFLGSDKEFEFYNIIKYVCNDDSRRGFMFMFGRRWLEIVIFSVVEFFLILGKK